MGVKTSLTLTQAQKLFTGFEFIQLLPTKDGIIDTTYIVQGRQESYILKKYERTIDERVIFDAKFLEKLHTEGLNIPLLLASSSGWYLYKKLRGSEAKTIQYRHITALGRFLAQLHQETAKITYQENFIERYSLSTLLREIKTKHYLYYKKLYALNSLTQKCDGFIHGDIFKDNTVFDGDKIGVFDFIDGGCGTFAFELGVVMLSFNPHSRRSYKKLLLSSYNQNAPKRVTLQELEENIKNAAKLYTLLRISHHSNTNRAKELAKLW
jgi:homoserine kinase type II